ncbi:MAG: glycosyltransferase, partial [Planctomycetota bacterium]
VVHLPPGFAPAPYRAAAAAAARRPACPHASAASRLLAGVPRPIAGYFGPLASYADPATLAACARALPEVSFVLAVPESAGRFRCLAGLPNVHIRGRVPPEDLPGLLGAFDAALLPLRRSAWVAPAHPPQLLPYLATGRPIVATPVAEVRALAGRLVRLARTRADFVAALRAALADCDPRAAAARQAVAARYTWDVWLDRLAPLLAGVAAVPGVDLVPEYVRRFRALYVFDALERHEFATAGSSDEPAGAAAADTDSVEAPRVLHLSGFPGLPNVPGGSGPVDVGEFTRPSLLETASLLQLCGFTAPSAQPAGDGR